MDERRDKSDKNKLNRGRACSQILALDRTNRAVRAVTHVKLTYERAAWPPTIDRNDEDAGSRGRKRLRLTQFIIPPFPEINSYIIQQVSRKKRHNYSELGTFLVFSHPGNFHI